MNYKIVALSENVRMEKFARRMQIMERDFPDFLPAYFALRLEKTDAASVVRPRGRTLEDAEKDLKAAKKAVDAANKRLERERAKSDALQGKQIETIPPSPSSDPNVSPEDRGKRMVEDTKTLIQSFNGIRSRAIEALCYGLSDTFNSINDIEQRNLKARKLIVKYTGGGYEPVAKKNMADPVDQTLARSTVLGQLGMGARNARSSNSENADFLRWVAQLVGPTAISSRPTVGVVSSESKTLIKELCLKDDGSRAVLIRELEIAMRSRDVASVPVKITAHLEKSNAENLKKTMAALAATNPTPPSLGEWILRQARNCQAIFGIDLGVSSR